MKPKIAYILVGAAKRRGKDTLAAMIVEALNKHPVANLPALVCARQYSFAAALREEVAQAFESTCVHYDVNTQDDVIKEGAVRPLLIAWGQMRRFQCSTYWVDQLMDRVDTDSQAFPAHPIDIIANRYQAPAKWLVAVVSDWRFPNELINVKDHCSDVLSVHITRPGVPYAGPDETKNDPLCEALSDVQILNNGSLNHLRTQAEFITQKLISSLQ
jgi:hypothetical protein